LIDPSLLYTDPELLQSFAPWLETARLLAGNLYAADHCPHLSPTLLQVTKTFTAEEPLIIYFSKYGENRQLMDQDLLCS